MREGGKLRKLGLVCFNSEVDQELYLPPTYDAGKVIKYIERAEANGSTALYSALRFALSELKGFSEARLILVTDGEDNSSTEEDKAECQALQDYFCSNH